MSDRSDAGAPETAPHRDFVADHQAAQHRRIVDAAGIDPSKLSAQARGILAWLSDRDDWTTGGIVELHQAARTAAQVAIHADTVDRKRAAFRESVDRTDAAVARCDEQWGLGR